MLCSFEAELLNKMHNFSWEINLPDTEKQILSILHETKWDETKTVELLLYRAEWLQTLALTNLNKTTSNQ